MVFKKKPEEKKIDKAIDRLVDAVADSPEVEKAIDKIADAFLGKCVECGGPLATGQTYVCAKHIRTN